MTEEEKPGTPAPASREAGGKESSGKEGSGKEDGKGLFTGNLSGWQIFLGIAVAAYLTYGKWQEMKAKDAPPQRPAASAAASNPAPAIPPRGVSYEGPLCKEYREGLRALVQGSANTVFRGGVKEDRDRFGCNAEDAGGNRRIATLGAVRAVDTAKGMAEYSAEFKKGERFQMAAEPGLGSAGFYAIGSHVKAGDKDYLLYFGHTATHIVSVSLAKGESADPEFSDAERKAAKDLALRLMQDFK